MRQAQGGRGPRKAAASMTSATRASLSISPWPRSIAQYENDPAVVSFMRQSICWHASCKRQKQAEGWAA